MSYIKKTINIVGYILIYGTILFLLTSNLLDYLGYVPYSDLPIPSLLDKIIKSIPSYGIMVFLIWKEKINNNIFLIVLLLLLFLILYYLVYLILKRMDMGLVAISIMFLLPVFIKVSFIYTKNKERISKLFKN